MTYQDFVLLCLSLFFLCGTSCRSKLLHPAGKTPPRLLAEGPLRPNAQALLGRVEPSHTKPKCSGLHRRYPCEGMTPKPKGQAVLGSVTSHMVPTRPGAPGSLPEGGTLLIFLLLILIIMFFFCFFVIIVIMLSCCSLKVNGFLTAFQRPVRGFDRYSNGF